MTPRKPTPPPLTLAQAAAISGLSIAAIRARIRRGIEPGSKVGRDWTLPGDWQPKQLKYTRKVSEVTK